MAGQLAPSTKKFKYRCMLLNGLENFVDPSIVPLSERTDLPDEAKALLFTPLTLPKGGGLTTSRWYTPPKGASSSSSSASPSSSLVSSLDPNAKAFTSADMTSAELTSVSSAHVSQGGLGSSRWATATNKTGILPVPTTAVVSSMISAKMIETIDPHVKTSQQNMSELPHIRAAQSNEKGKAPKLNDYVPPHLRVPLATKVILSNKIGNGCIQPYEKDSSAKVNNYVPPHLRVPLATETILSNKNDDGCIRGSVNSKLQVTSSYVLPHLRVPLAKALTLSDKNGDSGYVQSIEKGKVQDAINYTPPHLRVPLATYAILSNEKGSDSTKSSSGFALNPNGMNAQALSVSPDSLISCQAPQKSPKDVQKTYGIAKTSSTRSNSALEATRLATPDDFMSAAVNRAVSSQTHSEHVRPSTFSVVNVKAETQHLVREIVVSARAEAIPTKTASKSSLKGNILQDPVQKSKEIEHLTSAQSNTFVAPAVRNVKSPAVIYNELEDPRQVHAALMKEITSPDYGKPALPLTRAVLIENIGAAPRECSSQGLHVSSHGGEEIDHDAKFTGISGSKPDSRNHLAHVAVGLQDWDGKWGPAPCSWENERDVFEDDFIPAYISTWTKTVPLVSAPVDMKCDEFKNGQHPLSNLTFGEPIEHPPTHPNYAKSSNTDKQRTQTTEISAKIELRHQIKIERNRQRQAIAQAAQNAFIASQTPEIDPNAPTIPIYLRPAEEKDVPGITAIYNYYINNSIIPEDQTPMAEGQILETWKAAREESLPFIVAIKGSRPTKKLNSKQNETVVGYARAEAFYGVGGHTNGRSRYTAEIEFYAHHKYLRKGIGRSLLDRILQCTSSQHGAKDGYEWHMPNSADQKVYATMGGRGRRYHQLLIRRPVEVKNDPDHEWLKQWLEGRFFFFQVARMQSIARSKTTGSHARFLDIVTFQLEANQPAEFEVFQ